MAQKKKQNHQTKSFDQLVADAQIKRLEPIVDQKVEMAMFKVNQAIFNFVMREKAATQTRQMALENLLKKHAPWFTEEALALEIAQVEDDAQGLISTTGPVEVGNKVRADFQIKSAGADDFGPVIKIAIHEVGVENTEGTVQTHKDLEAALLGMSVGESKEFDLQETEDSEPTSCKVTVVKISRTATQETSK